MVCQRGDTVRSNLGVVAVSVKCGTCWGLDYFCIGCRAIDVDGATLPGLLK